MRFTTALRSFFLLVVMALSASVSFAQFSGSVAGTVQDASGAAVPKANVTIVHIATQITNAAVTDANGTFNVESLAPGTYEITAEAAGFAKTVQRVVLNTNQRLAVTMTLSLKSVSTSVQVTEQAPVVNPDESRNQLNLEHQAVDELPVAGRSVVGLATLAPGVNRVRHQRGKRARFGRGQLFHGNCGGCERQRPRPDVQHVAGGRARCHQRHPARCLEPDPKS